MSARGNLFTITRAKQIDFLMMYARRELNVTSRGGGWSGYQKLPGPGERFSYSVMCVTCDVSAEFLPSAKRALMFLFDHLGHRIDVLTPAPRSRTQTEVGDAKRYRRARVRQTMRALSTKE